MLLLSIYLLILSFFLLTVFVCFFGLFLSSNPFQKRSKVGRWSKTTRTNAVVDKAARGGETVLKHLESIRKYVFSHVFTVLSVIIHSIIGVFGGVFPSKQREK